MTRWIALLRGVNVGGITIKSADLAAVFDGLGFHDVKTVLASGNVRFAASPEVGERADLKSRIETALRERFGYEAWILLITRTEAEAAIERFPFHPDDAARQPWVIFCADAATRTELADAAASLDDHVDPVAGAGKAEPQVLYWNPRTGTTTDTPFARVLAKAKYKSRTTNRNLRTLLRIVG